MNTVYYADDDRYVVREATLMGQKTWTPELWITLDGQPTKVYAHQVKPTRQEAIDALIRFANERIAAGQEAHRALCRLKRGEPFEPASAADADCEFRAVDKEIAIPVTGSEPVIVDDDEADADPEDTPIWEPDAGDPVARLEPAGAACDGPAFHGDPGR